MKLNKKGFSLIELMVAVGIIATLSMIAVPNFQRFAAKAKQANAKTELASIYSFETAFMTEFNMFHQNLPLVGYTPDGATLDLAPATAGCPTALPVGRLYLTGFLVSVGNGVPNGIVKPVGGIAVIPACATAGLGSSYNRDALLLPVPAVLTAAAVVGATTFLAQAHGMIRAGGLEDQWTINETKTLVNTQIGF